MDGLTEEALTQRFLTAFRRHVGTVTHDRFAQHSFARSLARKLIAHFNEVGWPETEEELLIYVREAIERYG